MNANKMGTFILVIFTLMSMMIFVAGAAEERDAEAIVPEVESLYESYTGLYDQLLQQDENMVQVEAKTASQASKENDNAESLVVAIVDLKAYCMAAKKKLDSSDEFKGDHDQNAVIHFIKGFGDNTGKDVVTEYASIIGDLKAAHPEHAGVAGYLLDELNKNVLHQKKIVQLGARKPFVGMMRLRYKKFGLREMPNYFKTLAVYATDFNAAKAALHEGNAGKAIAAWKKGGDAALPEQMYAKVVAKYSSMQQAHEILEEAGAKVAIQASYDKNKDRKDHNPIPALPVAGATGGTKVREMKKFVMPDQKAMKKEALKMADDYLKAMGREHTSAIAVAKAIEAKLQGTTIRVTTGVRMFAESTQVPTVKIVGSHGTIEKPLEYLPLGGQTMSQTYPNPDGGSIGEIKRIVIKNDAKTANPWLCTKFEVQVGHGNPWTIFYPNGKKSFVDGYWLDGSGGKMGPYYRLGHSDHFLMLPALSELVYTKAVAGKVPECANIVATDMKDGNACFSGSQLEFQKKCDATPKCQGYSYTKDAKEGGSGCLKYRCFNTKTGGSGEGFTEVGKEDFFNRQAFHWVPEEVKSVCITTCGQDPVTLYGRVPCRNIKDGAEIDSARCENWTPTLTKPKPLEKKCAGTPKCVKWTTTTPSQMGKTCPTSCGQSSTTLYGQTKCHEVVSGQEVGDGKCNYWGLPKPSVPFQGCASTAICVHWATTGPPGCPGGCGQGASNQYGTVQCRANGNNNVVSDNNCHNWGLSKPGTPSTYCGGTGPCGPPRLGSGQCCLWLGGQHAGYCTMCPGGNHHVWPWTCGSSRKCN